MTRYMLDTNTVSHLIKGQLTVARRVVAVPMASLCISSITAGELLFGLAKRPDAKRLHAVVKEFLRCLDVLPWDGATAEHCATIRAVMEQQGKTLGPLDLLIAAHASDMAAVLVTNDRAFGRIAGLHVEDWTV
jgi:tRNA(fMet)-specific endonuclease VapC